MQTELWGAGWLTLLASLLLFSIVVGAWAAKRIRLRIGKTQFLWALELIHLTDAAIWWINWPNEWPRSLLYWLWWFYRNAADPSIDPGALAG